MPATLDENIAAYERMREQMREQLAAALERRRRYGKG